MRLYDLCCRPLGVCWGEFTAHLERKEYKCVYLLIDERVNYRCNAIFVCFFEIKFQGAQMLQNSETALSCCVVNYCLFKYVCLVDFYILFKKEPQSLDVAVVAQIVD